MENLAAIVSEKLNDSKIDNILVGGGCASIYSVNQYQSYDLDYITYENIKKVEKALRELGFSRKGKYFTHPNCKYIIEFISPPVAIGHESIKKFQYHKTSLGVIKMLTPTDSIKDRLASFYHWNDRQSLDQALMIYRENASVIDLKNIKNWSTKEKYIEKYNIFYNLILSHENV